MTTVGEAELRYGNATMSVGRRHAVLEISMARRLDIGIGARILPFDNTAARTYAVSVADKRRADRPISEADCRIAAASRALGSGLATCNVRDFEGTGVNVVAPWSAVPK